MRSLTLLIVSLVFFTFSCGDFGTTTVTYTKGTAVYGDLESLRQTALISGPQSIVDAGKIFISNEHLFIGEERLGIHILENSDPENPTPLLFLNIPGNREFYVEGNHLFAESIYDMLKIDISDITQPFLDTRIEFALGEQLSNNRGEAVIDFEFETVTEEMDIDNDFYRELWANDLTVYYHFDMNLIPQSAVPSSFASNSDGAIGTVNRIAYSQDHVYVISKSKMSVFDNSVGFESVFSESIGWGMETIYPRGSKLYVGTRQSMEVYNAENPALPEWESSFWHPTSCDPVFPVTEEIAYVTLRTDEFSNCGGDVNTLLVLNISNSDFIREIQQFEMESPFGMTLIEDKLYVGEGENGLKIFDATDKSNLRLQKWDQNVTAYDVIAHPDRIDLVLISGPLGFAQYQVSGNNEMQLLSQIAF